MPMPCSTARFDRPVAGQLHGDLDVDAMALDEVVDGPAGGGFLLVHDQGLAFEVARTKPMPARQQVGAWE